MNISAARPDAAARWPLYFGLVALLLLAAVAMGLWRERNPPAVPFAQPAPPALVAYAPAGPPKLLPEDLAGDEDEPSGLLADAFEAATGHRKGYVADDQGDQIVTVPVQVVRLPSGFALLTEATNNTGCHACLGILGIHYFRKESGRITVTGKPVEVGDKWGKPPRWRLTNAFTASPALLLSVHDHGQGVSFDSGRLIELAPAAPAVSDEIFSRWDDQGAPDPNGRGVCRVHGEIVNVRKDIGFDVRQTGTTNVVDRYRKRNGKFVAVSGMDWDNPCPNRGPPPPDLDPPLSG